MLRKLGEVELQRESESLEDGGHVSVSCSNCDRPLLDVWSTRPKDEKRRHIRAECPYCGDTSFVVEVPWQSHIGGAGQNTCEDGNAVPKTSIISTELVDEVFVLTLKREN